MSALELVRDAIALIEAGAGSSRTINRIVLSANVYDLVRIEMYDLCRTYAPDEFTHLWDIPVFCDPTRRPGTFEIETPTLSVSGSTGNRSDTRP